MGALVWYCTRFSQSPTFRMAIPLLCDAVASIRPSRERARVPSPSNSPGDSRTTAPVETFRSVNRLPSRVANNEPSAAKATSSMPSRATMASILHRVEVEGPDPDRSKSPTHPPRRERPDVRCPEIGLTFRFQRTFRVENDPPYERPGAHPWSRPRFPDRANRRVARRNALPRESLPLPVRQGFQ